MSCRRKICSEPDVSGKKLILASQSPRRSELLQRCGVDFSICSADVEELERASDLRDLPRLNALEKARAVSLQHPGKLVLGADTMILFENKAVGKPRDLADAARILRDFSGKNHEVITGIAFCVDGVEMESWSESSTVWFKKLSGAVIEEYLSKVVVLDKAGAYGIQEHGELLIEDFSGELENIIGLPLKKLCCFLKKIGILAQHR